MAELSEQDKAWANERLLLLLSMARDPSLTPDKAEAKMQALIDDQHRTGD